MNILTKRSPTPHGRTWTSSFESGEFLYRSNPNGPIGSALQHELRLAYNKHKGLTANNILPRYFYTNILNFPYFSQVLPNTRICMFLDIHDQRFTIREAAFCTIDCRKCYISERSCMVSVHLCEHVWYVNIISEPWQ